MKLELVYLTARNCTPYVQVYIINGLNIRSNEKKKLTVVKFDRKTLCSIM